MATIGHYKHKNPNRKNFWVERFRVGYRSLKFYEPTLSSRKRIARLIRCKYLQYDTGRAFIYCKDPKKA